MEKIFGRNQEIEIISSLYHAQRAEFLAVYGRRRVGKTFLISQCLKDKGVYFELTGVKDASRAVQLANFVQVFRELNELGPLNSIPEDWFEAFKVLRCAIEKCSDDQKIILFFDELPWLATAKSGFLQALEHSWNRYFSRMPNVLLVVCGSAASWMIEKIIYNKGGLYGRLSKEICLKPFMLQESYEFLNKQGVSLSKKDFLELYMMIGGVPKYLTQVRPGLSCTQIVNEMCFTPQGYLMHEFLKLYSSLFNHSEVHIKIVKVLAKHHYGLTRNELLHEVGLSTGGRTTSILKELEVSGFILRLPSFGKNKVSSGLYRLSDEYSLFYIKWIEPELDGGTLDADQDCWTKARAGTKVNSWLGYAFETLCFKHIQCIKTGLGISGVSTKISSWKYVPESQEEQGAQIDLVIDRSDHCINLCEIKFSDSEFVIDKSYALKLEQKKALFRRITNTKKSLMTTLITVYGAKENMHYHSAVQNQITADVFFS